MRCKTCNKRIPWIYVHKGKIFLSVGICQGCKKELKKEGLLKSERPFREHRYS